MKFSFNSWTLLIAVNVELMMLCSPIDRELRLSLFDQNFIPHRRENNDKSKTFFCSCEQFGMGWIKIILNGKLQPKWVFPNINWLRGLRLIGMTWHTPCRICLVPFFPAESDNNTWCGIKIFSVWLPKNFRKIKM